MKKRSKGYHHGNLSEAVLEAGHKLIESEGVKAVTLRRIAKTVGISPNALYYHFRDKAAFLEALATDGFTALITNMKKVSKSGLTPSLYFQAIGKGYVTYALSHPELFRPMFNPHQTAQPISDQLQQVSSQSFQVFLEAVTYVQGSENSDAEVSLISTISAWALVHGLSVLLTEQRLSASPEAMRLKRDKIIDQAAAIFTRGLTSLEKR